MVDEQSLLERFLRYVKIETTAREGSSSVPTSKGQLKLGQMLVEELKAMGVADASQDENGVVMGTVPGNVEGNVPVVAFNSHVDTSPDASGKNVQPQVIRDYDGGDIVLPAREGMVIKVAETPELKGLDGCTIITTDGTTLLGGDDKAGVAVIMEAARTLCQNTDIKHGPMKVLFTCDEEIGRGVEHVDLEKLAADVAYTLDGAGRDEIDQATFSADMATVELRGVAIHPSIAKGKMVNAVRAAGYFLSLLPNDRLSPETTEGDEGFLHPYRIIGSGADVTIGILLRDFDTPKLAEYAAMLNGLAEKTVAAFPGLKADVQIRKQYRNMAEGLVKEPRAVSLAEEAIRSLGGNPQLTKVRGGTDGSQLTERGLPTPNLSTGQHTPHSPLEWACLDEMVHAVKVVVRLCELWGKESR